VLNQEGGSLTLGSIMYHDGETSKLAANIPSETCDMVEGYTRDIQLERLYLPAP